MPYYVYILECINKTLYTGLTNNLARRLEEHKTGKGGHYTSYNPGQRIRYYEEYPNRSKAAKREAQIKSWSRTKKIALIKGDKGILKAAARCKKRSNPLAALKY
ncbi:GIY-YIG nuclease family protein [Candidatus Saganbacteria bacterium]|nr:GIY-YIG nuclease family protein [Candidatus Saganbacteria bacterium]